MGHPDFVTPSKSATSFQINRPADPGNNGNIVVTVPAQEEWRVLTMRVRLVTDGNPANRTMYVRFMDDLGNDVFTIIGNNQVPAGTTRDEYWGAAIGASVGGVAAQSEALPLPELYLLPGWSAQWSYLNAQVGDRLSRALLLAERIVAIA